MNFYFYTNVAFENWDYNNSVKKGIGGSETSIVEMSWRLAQRGHKVTVYAPIKKTTKSPWRGVKWIRYEKATFKEDGVWVLYRCPDAIDKFIPKRESQIVWFLMQDWDYPTWTDKRIERMDKVITLCQAHATYTLKNHPKIAERMWISSNGVKVELVEEVEKEEIKRNPLRIIHASSPDRGLKQAILIFRKAREYVPDLEFHAFYGFDNLLKLTKRNPQSTLAKTANEILELIKTTKGIVFHGRVSQPQLYREFLKSGMYLYITDFFETSNIASQEAQAMGAVPVFSPIFAQKENIKFGIGVEGRSNEPLTISRAASEVVRLALTPKLQESIRPEMMKWARERFNWENFVTQWEMEAKGERKQFEKLSDFPVQIKFTDRNVNKGFNFKKKPFEQYTQEFIGDVKGKTVLDVGGYDGKQADWCMEKGAMFATVVDNQTYKIYDRWPDFKPFESVKYIDDDVLNYTEKADIVICQNVIYHTRNPWLIVERLRNLTRETMVISTSYIAGKTQVWKVYRPFEGHPKSWTVAWRPTLSGLRALLEANGFEILEEKEARGHVVMKCKPVKVPVGFKKL